MQAATRRVRSRIRSGQQRLGTGDFHKVSLDQAWNDPISDSLAHRAITAVSPGLRAKLHRTSFRFSVFFVPDPAEPPTILRASVPAPGRSSAMAQSQLPVVQSGFLKTSRRDGWVQRLSFSPFLPASCLHYMGRAPKCPLQLRTLSRSTRLNCSVSHRMRCSARRPHGGLDGCRSRWRSDPLAPGGFRFTCYYIVAPITRRSGPILQHALWVSHAPVTSTNTRSR
jgi:hypothetical protein